MGKLEIGRLFILKAHPKFHTSSSKPPHPKYPQAVSPASITWSSNSLWENILIHSTAGSLDLGRLCFSSPLHGILFLASFWQSEKICFKHLSCYVSHMWLLNSFHKNYSHSAALLKVSSPFCSFTVLTPRFSLQWIRSVSSQHNGIYCIYNHWYIFIFGDWDICSPGILCDVIMLSYYQTLVVRHCSLLLRIQPFHR